LIKGTFQQERIIIIEIYIPKVSALNFIKQTLLDIKTQIDPNKIMLGDLNSPLSSVDGLSKQKFNNEI
jgi:hypothetical protein